MLEIYRFEAGRTMTARVAPDAIAPDAMWIDAISPSPAEIHAIEALCSIELPSKEDMREIEVTSRLYSEDGADFMTASVGFGQHEGQPSFAPVTFILAGERLVTIRYTEPKSFALFAAKLCREAPGDAEALAALAGQETGKRSRGPSADSVLIGLLEAVIDRIADMLEGIAADLDQIGSDIFAASSNKRPTGTADFKELLRRLGSAGDLSSKARESLAIFDRMMPFLQITLDRRKPLKETKARVKAMARDVQSLNDFVSFLSNKTTFLLDTTVGMISIEQNGIIKIFSVAAVGFMPPTLVASIYGMNFHFMPELDWPFGYPFALGLMLISAVVPLVFFRYKRWL
ncbi:magnesium transporter CorA family protein [Consotaella aegiceratis]|uniref:magnesium transporter CorA family protein n=1 Tax=Consotaella aegiceratis TaxID=3097961 RepID=UPI002F42ABA3